ncbi:hypothetical protein PRZ48_007887 [Zasmidium cellare]|uniref:Zn(2)-C6 fungal-type domain-containing protein n=1 Tax=Zasmidium cellare TaxID=395010 RepID=A0ABR0ELC5_ZASCE|nr:hypothetical protein PRZ48_007887 [Zasmidium cellare]
MAGPAGKRTAKSKEQEPPPQLSCELCREKKMKCDKQDPCGNCKTSGAECKTVFRHRLPRGRHVRAAGDRSTSPTQDISLDGAVGVQEPSGWQAGAAVLAAEQADGVLYNLEVGSVCEATIQDMRLTVEKQVLSADGSRMNSIGQASNSTIPTRRAAKKRAVSDDDFDNTWSDGLRNSPETRDFVRSRPGSEFRSQQGSPMHLNDSNDDSTGLSVWNNGVDNPASHRSTKGPINRSRALESLLCDVYLCQVDPLIKILHRPTVDRWLRKGQPYLHYPQGHRATEALAWGVCYSAVCSLTQEQCQTLLQQDRSIVIADCRHACENALDQAGYLTTDDLAVLQTFVLYLVGRRVDDRSLASWTLTAVLVRIATAQNIHVKEATIKDTVFNVQLRTRLWLTICLIDLQTSVAQSSQPLISVQDVKPALSAIKNVNDDDLTNQPASLSAIQDREELTDVTLAKIWYYFQVTGRLLHGSGSSTSDEADHSLGSFSGTDYGYREQEARDFQRNALGLLSFCDTESSPYAWFTWHTAQYLVSSVRISAVRPVSSALPPDSAFPVPSKGHPGLFERHIGVLKKALQMQRDPRAEGFRWFIAIPWTEIAIASSECLACNDPRIVCRAWHTIEAAFQLYESRAVRNKTYDMLLRRMNQVQQMQQAQQAKQIQQIQHIQQAQKIHQTQQKQQSRLSQTPIPSMQMQPTYQYQHADTVPLMKQTSVPVKMEHSLPPTPWPTPRNNSPSETSWMATIPNSPSWSSSLSLMGDNIPNQSLASGSNDSALYPNAQTSWNDNKALQQALLSLDSWQSSGAGTTSFDNMNVDGGALG